MRLKFVIGFFVLFATGVLGGLVLQSVKRAKGVNEPVPIRAIVQTGPLKEALKTAYLAELLELSVDRPTLSSDFNLKGGEEKLLASPVIKEATIQMQEPGVLYIDYTTRTPVALLADYENVALDSDGYPFPVIPFFSPKNLPELYLGLEEEIEYGSPIRGEKKDLAYAILAQVSQPIVCDLFNVKCIDVSNAFEKSYGRKEIVLRVEDIFFSNEEPMCLPRLLRLSTRHYSQDLANYLKLQEKALEKQFEPGKETIIDFRIPQLAFIDRGD